MSTLPSEESTDWYAVSAVMLGTGAFATAQGLTYPLLALLLEARGSSPAVIGAHVAAFMLGLVAAVVAIPHLLARMSATALIVGALLCAAGILMGYAVTDDAVAWLVLRFGLGFCVNMIYVVGEAWLSIASGHSRRGRIVGLYGAVMSGGFALGSLAIPFWGDGGRHCICLLRHAGGQRRHAVLARCTPSPLGDTLVFARRAPGLLLMVLLFGALDATFLSVVPGHLARMGAPAAEAALVVTAVHLGMVLAQPLLGVLLDRYSARACLSTASASLLMLAFLPSGSPALWLVAGAGVAPSLASIQPRWQRWVSASTAACCWQGLRLSGWSMPLAALSGRLASA